MNWQQALEQYWLLLVLALWLVYKWWSARRALAMLPALKLAGASMVDVRSAEEFAQGHAPGTINIPLPQLGTRLSEISKTSPVVLCCASGTRSGMAKLLLKKNGYSAVHNVGAWTKLLN